MASMLVVVVGVAAAGTLFARASDCAAMVAVCAVAVLASASSFMALPLDEPKLPMRRIVLDEIEIVGDRANPNTAEEALSLLVNKRIDLSPLMTHRFALNDFAAALDTYEQRRNGAVKVAVKP